MGSLTIKQREFAAIGAKKGEAERGGGADRGKQGQYEFMKVAEYIRSIPVQRDL